MKLTLLILSIFLSSTCLSQEVSRQYHFKQIGWTINVPLDFEIMDSALNAEKMKNGQRIIENATDATTDISKTITLLGATKNTLNYFNATLTPFEGINDSEYAQNTKIVHELTYTALVANMPKAVLDSSSSTVTIDGLNFNKFIIKISIDGNEIFTMGVLSKLYKNYDFGITYLYMDAITKEQIDSMLSNSKFSK